MSTTLPQSVDPRGHQPPLTRTADKIDAVSQPCKLFAFPGLTMARQASALVTSKWLADAFRAQRKMRILDTSWYLPKLKRNPKSEFKRRHIPGAAFFDLDQCCDRSSPLDHMLPSEELFADYVGRLGIDNDTQVVLYDCSEFGVYCNRKVS